VSPNKSRMNDEGTVSSPPIPHSSVVVNMRGLGSWRSVIVIVIGREGARRGKEVERIMIREGCRLMLLSLLLLQVYLASILLLARTLIRGSELRLTTISFLVHLPHSHFPLPVNHPSFLE